VKVSIKAGAGQVTPIQRPSFGLGSLLAASLFSRKAQELEELLVPQEMRRGADVLAHRSYVLSAVVMAALALEGVINEFLFSAGDEHTKNLCGLSKSERDTLAKFWKESHAVCSTLEKYQESLRLLGKDAFGKGREPFRTAHSVAGSLATEGFVAKYGPPVANANWEVAPPDAKRIEDEFLRRCPAF